MILCHPHKLIFLKTKKTAGTSFEIALSEFCGPDCVITPISPADEATRQALGHRGPQNVGAFYNHIPAHAARRLIGEEIWSSYRKITLCRDPYDAAISRYFWEGGPKTGLDFGQFADRFRLFFGENAEIAPLDSMDYVIRHDRLEQDIQALGIAGLWQGFQTLRAKSDRRPGTGASVAEVYAAYPEAARIVAQECPEEIRRFGYTAPGPALRLAGGADAAHPHVFTLTAGRSGTAWLGKLIAQKAGGEVIHESLRPEDFGTRMPDLRVMRAFNNYGRCRDVRSFWHRKLDTLNPRHFETNHTLAKCGLIETLAESDLAEKSAVVVLRRNLVDQTASYLMRGDFTNITLEWQWYLSPAYRNVIVNPQPLLPLGAAGRAIWYSFEMAARQAYYMAKFGDRLRFVQADLDLITDDAAAANTLLGQLGLPEGAALPDKANASAVDDATQSALRAEVAQLLARFPFDPAAVAQDYIAAGRDLAMPALPRAHPMQASVA